MQSVADAVAVFEHDYPTERIAVEALRHLAHSLGEGWGRVDPSRRRVDHSLRYEHMFVSPRPLPDRPALDGNLAARVRPLASAMARQVPVVPSLEHLLGGGLQRGTVAVVVARPGNGGATLGLTLLSAASSAGHWCGVVGLHDPGVVAMADLGIDLRRVVFVPTAGEPSDVASDLVDGVDVVLLAPRGPVPYGAARHLAAKVRDRKAVLVVVVSLEMHWPLPGDVDLEVVDARWSGVDHGHGRLAARQATVLARGRRRGGAVTSATLWLPSERGEVALVGGG